MPRIVRILHMLKGHCYLLIQSRAAIAAAIRRVQTVLSDDDIGKGYGKGYNILLIVVDLYRAQKATLTRRGDERQRVGIHRLSESEIPDCDLACTGASCCCYTVGVYNGILDGQYQCLSVVDACSITRDAGAGDPDASARILTRRNWSYDLGLYGAACHDQEQRQEVPSAICFHGRK